MTNRTVLVLLDTPASELHTPVLEALTVARGLGRVEAVAVEAPSLEVLAQLGSYGVEIVRQAEFTSGLPADARHLGPVLGEALASAVRVADADLVLVTSTFVNKEAAALAAYRTDAGLVIDAEGLADREGSLVATKRVFAATWEVVSEFDGRGPAVATLRANSVVPTPAQAAVATVVEGFRVDVAESVATVRVVSRVDHPHGGEGRPALAEAAVVVAGGRGTNGDFTPVVELADALGGAVGATRDAVYEGWFDQFVGQTGVSIAPRLYIGAGISGAPHHREGMQSAQVIVAVNNDPECPLFEIADFAVVGDLADVLPQAAAAIRDHRAR